MSDQRSGVSNPNWAVTQVAYVPLAEFGDTVKIEGVVVGDGHKRLALYLPGESMGLAPISAFYEMSLDEALAWLQQSDDPTSPEYTDDINGILKAIVRKASRQVDQNVAWKCYERDGYECKYCGAKGVPLTYDHYLAQAVGGKTTVENGVSACRPCNKRKGHMTVAAWIEFMHEKGYKYANKYQTENS